MAYLVIYSHSLSHPPPPNEVPPGTILSHDSLRDGVRLFRAGGRDKIFFNKLIPSIKCCDAQHGSGSTCDIKFSSDRYYMGSPTRGPPVDNMTLSILRILLFCLSIFLGTTSTSSLGHVPSLDPILTGLLDMRDVLHTVIETRDEDQLVFYITQLLATRDILSNHETDVTLIGPLQEIIENMLQEIEGHVDASQDTEDVLSYTMYVEGQKDVLKRMFLENLERFINGSYKQIEAYVGERGNFTDAAVVLENMRLHLNTYSPYLTEEECENVKNYYNSIVQSIFAPLTNSSRDSSIVTEDLLISENSLAREQVLCGTVTTAIEQIKGTPPDGSRTGQGLSTDMLIVIESDHEGEKESGDKDDKEVSDPILSEKTTTVTSKSLGSRAKKRSGIPLEHSEIKKQKTDSSETNRKKGKKGRKRRSRPTKRRSLRQSQRTFNPNDFSLANKSADNQLQMALEASKRESMTVFGEADPYTDMVPPGGERVRGIYTRIYDTLIEHQRAVQSAKASGTKVTKSFNPGQLFNPLSHALRDEIAEFAKYYNDYPKVAETVKKIVGKMYNRYISSPVNQHFSSAKPQK